MRTSRTDAVKTKWIASLLACGLSACSGTPEAPATPEPTTSADPRPDEAEPRRAPSPGPSASATIVGSCTLAEYGSCQTFYSDNPRGATAASQCADAHGIWSDVCPPINTLAICVTLDGRPLAAFYPPQPPGDFGAGCTELGGRLAP